MLKEHISNEPWQREIDDMMSKERVVEENYHKAIGDCGKRFLSKERKLVNDTVEIKLDENGDLFIEILFSVLACEDENHA